MELGCVTHLFTHNTVENLNFFETRMLHNFIFSYDLHTVNYINQAEFVAKTTPINTLNLNNPLNT